MAAILIASGSSVDAMTKERYMALHLAVEHGHPNVVETLLGHGATVNARGDDTLSALLRFSVKGFH